MSIANEIVRLNTAKEAMKTAINKRGVTVADDATLDLYPDMIEGIPYAVNGSFTPEEDTNTFELSGMDYEPYSIIISCVDFEDNVVPSSVVLLVGFKGNPGGAYYYTNSSEKKFAFLKSTSSIISWGQNGIVIKVSSANSGYFKKGYTYNYVITGGVAP